jgi:hypothetical protein
LTVLAGDVIGGNNGGEGHADSSVLDKDDLLRALKTSELLQ